MALSTTPAHAANALASAEVQIFPAFESAALRLNITGDDNRNAGGTVEFRVQGDSNWQNGHKLVPTLPTRLNSLLFNLLEGTTYEVRVTPTDPDGEVAPVTTTFTTRTTPRPAANGRRLYVSTTGSPSPTGSLTAPYGKVTDALKAAQPGDTILLQPGTYTEWVYNYFKSGEPGRPITIKAAAPGVRFIGYDQKLYQPHATPLWTRQADGTWSTPLASLTSYVAVDGVRLYHYKTQAALQAAVSTGGYPGWWQDSTNRIFVTLAGGVSPDTARMQVAQTNEAFRLLGVHDLIFEGLDVGYYGIGYGMGFYLTNSSNVTIRNSNIHHTIYGVFIKEGLSSNNLIENCKIWDQGLENWDWASIKGTDAEGVGIMIGNAGTGNVVRRSNFFGVFNGVAVIGNGETSGDTDVYYNWFHEIGDDGIEPEGDVPDFRAWCNTVRHTQNAISLAPINVGPAWVLFNTLTEYNESGLKISRGSVGAILAYHNTVVTTKPNSNAFTPWSAMSNTTIRNNIFMGTRYVIEDYYTTSSSNSSFNNDLLFTTDPYRFVKMGGVQYTSLSKLQTAGQEVNGVVGNPQFVGLSWGDFRLQPTSPARHRGAVIPGINDFLGYTPDIGAFQMGR